MTPVRSLVAAIIIASAMPAHAQQAQSPALPGTPAQTPVPTTQTPTTQTPTTQSPTTQSPTAPPVPGAPTTSPGTPLVPTLPPVTTRTFTAPVGLWFLTVRPDRAAEFEQAIAHLQAALAKATDARTREQAKGWRMLKASEPGPNATVMYVFLIDPTIQGADYGLGGALASAYPDTTELAEIWRMYTGAITGGGSLLNLTPIAPKIVPFGEKARPLPVAPSAAPAPTPGPTTPPTTPSTAPPAVPQP